MKFFATAAASYLGADVTDLRAISSEMSPLPTSQRCFCATAMDSHRSLFSHKLSGARNKFQPTCRANLNFVNKTKVEFQFAQSDDVIKTKFMKLWVFFHMIGKSMMQNAYLPKISILLQFGGEILAVLCSDDSTQILLILPQFQKLEGFVWGHQEITKLVSRPQRC